jgi:hypothetical protein
MPVAEASSTPQAEHCKRSLQEKPVSAFQSRMELACSNADIACLFQESSFVQNCTLFSYGQKSQTRNHSLLQALMEAVLYHLSSSLGCCPSGPPGIFSGQNASNLQENIMPQTPHNRVAELHNLAAHAHTAAATAHGKGDHLTAHELTKQAHEHSMNAHKASEELARQHSNSSKQ